MVGAKGKVSLPVPPPPQADKRLTAANKTITSRRVDFIRASQAANTTSGQDTGTGKFDRWSGSYQWAVGCEFLLDLTVSFPFGKLSCYTNRIFNGVGIG